MAEATARQAWSRPGLCGTWRLWAHRRGPHPPLVEAAPRGPVAPACRPAVRFPSVPGRGLSSVPSRRFFRNIRLPSHVPRKNMLAILFSADLHALVPIYTTATQCSMFMCSLQKILWQNNINISKGHYAFNNFCAPDDLTLAFSSVCRCVEAGCTGAVVARTHSAVPAPTVRSCPPVLDRSPRRPDLVGQVPGVVFRGSAASEPHGAGALAMASASSDSHGRGRMSLRVSLKDKRDPCGPRGLAPSLSIPREEGPRDRDSTGTRLVPCFHWGLRQPQRPCLSVHGTPVSRPLPRALLHSQGISSPFFQNSPTGFCPDGETTLSTSQGVSVGVTADRRGSSRQRLLPAGAGRPPPTTGDTALTTALAHAGPGATLGGGLRSRQVRRRRGQPCGL